MKKKLLLVFLALVAIFACAFGLTACDSDSDNKGKSNSTANGSDNQDDGQYADSIAYDGLIYSAVKEKGKVIAYSVSGVGVERYSDVIIASAVEGKPVTSIADLAFDGYTELEYLTIPDSVKSIGKHAFSECTRLTEIAIGSGVTRIGERAFWKCGRLESIVVAEENKAYYVDGNCLIQTKSKTLVLGTEYSIIPNDESVTEIGDFAFSHCYGLTDITIPESVKRIGDFAFNCCIGLTNLTVPDSVTEIGISAFSYCYGLERITIGGGVTKIGISTFLECNKLRSITFNETKAQWEAIEKSDYWDYNTGNYTVHCKDGDISK